MGAHIGEKTMATLIEIPAHNAPIWVDGRVTNSGDIPLWSGRGPVPTVGSEVICNDKQGTVVCVTGYIVEHGWLMVEGYRVNDPTATIGNLAGAEIRHPVGIGRHMSEEQLSALTLSQLVSIIRSTKPDGEFAQEVTTSQGLIARYFNAMPTPQLREMCDEFGIYADEGNDLLCDMATEELSLRETEAWMEG